MSCDKLKNKKEAKRCLLKILKISLGILPTYWNNLAKHLQIHHWTENYICSTLGDREYAVNHHHLQNLTFNILQKTFHPISPIFKKSKRQAWLLEACSFPYLFRHVLITHLTFLGVWYQSALITDWKFCFYTSRQTI